MVRKHISESTTTNTEVSIRAIEGLLTAFAPLASCDHVECYARGKRNHEIDVMV